MFNSNYFKFRQIGVPTQDLFLSQVLKVCNLVESKLDIENTKSCSVEAQIPSQFELARLISNRASIYKSAKVEARIVKAEFLSSDSNRTRVEL